MGVVINVKSYNDKNKRGVDASRFYDALDMYALPR